MNYWLFQSLAERYDIRDDEIVKEGITDSWYATRYRSKMKPGDKVFFWLGGIGEKRGVYAYGTLKSEPYKKSDWDAFGIDVKYDKKLNNPICIETIKENKILCELLILRAPQAGITRV